MITLEMKSTIGYSQRSNKNISIGALKPVNPSNKKDELKQIEGICPQNLMSNLIRSKLKEIVNLKDIFKTKVLHYKPKRIKVQNFSEYPLPF